MQNYLVRHHRLLCLLPAGFGFGNQLLQPSFIDPAADGQVDGLAGKGRQQDGITQLDRMDALDRLGKGSEAIYLANIFIMLLFISIETPPIFVKLISSRSPYDYLLDEHEHVFKMNHLEKTTLLENGVMEKVTFDSQVVAHRTNARIDAEKELVDHAIKGKVTELKKGALEWKNALTGGSLLES